MEATLPSPNVTRAARILGRRGGVAAAKAMTPEQRQARARKASAASILVRQKHRKENTE
jgi:hypothetical protein